MDRCAVLVDAGYLYAEGGKLCCGTRGRGRSALQPFLAVKLLEKVALEATKLPVLRTYWYDGAATASARRSNARLLGYPTSSFGLAASTQTTSRRVSTL